MEGSASTNKNNWNPIPKLRKNRKIESRWGTKYYTALKNAIFSKQFSTYTPPEPPPFMMKDLPWPEPLHLCKECNDCFRFKSSYEEHISRRSWILGYWCHQCFVTVCTHSKSSGESPCAACVKLDRDKRLHLRRKGLCKTQKLGAVKIFHNQCQFFAHLKSHWISLVDMADLMLMPIPTDMIGNHWPPEFHVACEALMEHAFISKKHVVDWLKGQEVETNWWLPNADTTVSKVIRDYKTGFVSTESTEEGQSSSGNSQSGFSSYSMEKDINKSLEFSEKTNELSSDEVKEEYEDNPCMPTDITFVDCGPAPKGLAPELPVYNAVRKQTTILVKPKQDFSPNKLQTSNTLQSKRKKVNRILSKCASPDMPISYGNTTITPRVSHSDLNTEKLPTRVASDVKVEAVPQTQDASNEIKQQASSDQLKSLPRKSSQVPKRKNVPILPANQKVLTVQHSKNVDLSTIINHISPQLGTNKRIVFIGQDTDGPAVKRKQDLGQKIIHVLPEVSISKNLRRIQPKIASLPKSENLTDDDKDARNVSSNPSIPKARSMPLTSTKVIIQNGRKYIIKQSASPRKCGVGPKSFISAPKSVQIVKQTPAENEPTTSTKPQLLESSTSPESVSREDVSPLTPSPSPSEQSNSSSCDAQTKQALPAIKNEPQAYTPRISDYGVPEQYENLSFCKGSDENLYLNVTPFKRNLNHSQSDTQAMIAKCKQEMLNEFFHLPFLELKRRVEHLQDINDEITNLLKCVAENVVREKLKAVHILQHVLKHCMEKCSNVSDEVSTDSTLHDWEVTYDTLKHKPVCIVCEKALKPECYIPGFSKPAKNEELYCPCYKQFCHKCDMYQGNSTRFIAHHNFHSKAKPFLCPDCYQRFRSFKLLEIHTWSACFHTLKKRVFRCKICEIDGFGDIESITRHFAIMHSNTKIVCNVCHIVLPSLTEYKYHMKSQHRTEKCTEPIRVVLCKLGQCIVRCENFMLHMEKHVVEQKLVLWFKCPFCPFVDLEAKRLMPHLQTKHLHRLTEIISPEALGDLLPKDLANAALGVKSQEPSEDPASEFINEEPSEDGTLLPKIINTRTITSEVFERGAPEVEDTGTDSGNASLEKTDVTEQNDSASWVTQTDEAVPKIVNITSDSIVNVSHESNKTDTLPKILDVRSIADAGSKSVESTTDSVATTSNVELKKSDNKDIKTRTQSNENLEDPHKSSNEDFAKPDPVEQPGGTVTVDKCSTDSSVTVTVTTAPTKSSAKHSLEKTEKSSDEEKLKDTINNSPPQSIPISKPPPLARIPQHILQANAGPRPHVPQPKSVREKAQTQGLRQFRMTRQPKQRIALNAPNTPSETDLNFACHLCGELINTSWSVLSTHYKKSHSMDHKLFAVNPVLEGMTADFINNGYKDFINGTKRKTDTATLPPKRRRRWNAKKYITEGRNTNSPSLGICVQQETAEDGQGNFVCKKCNLRCKDMVNLREHIAEAHRIKGRYLICLECGDNFVVAPSLQMHLKAFHGIQDPITYMSKNTLYAPDDIDDSDEECVTTEGNQCHVCMAVFENKAAVDKHLRVHGMAFLNRRMNEARNARKSPEQAQKTVNDTQKSLKETSKELVKRDKPAISILDKISATI